MEKAVTVADAVPVVWEGDLDDDCIARWHSLTLRAEEMDRSIWWWAVYDAEGGEAVMDSHTSSTVARSGKQARAAAEAAAREWRMRKATR